MTGRAFKIMTEEFTSHQIKSLIPKVKVLGNLRAKDTEEVLTTFKKHSKGDPLLYVHDGYGDDNF